MPKPARSLALPAQLLLAALTLAPLARANEPESPPAPAAAAPNGAAG